MCGWVSGFESCRRGRLAIGFNSLESADVGRLQRISTAQQFQCAPRRTGSPWVKTGAGDVRREFVKHTAIDGGGRHGETA